MLIDQVGREEERLNYVVIVHDFSLGSDRFTTRRINTLSFDDLQ